MLLPLNRHEFNWQTCILYIKLSSLKTLLIKGKEIPKKSFTQQKFVLGMWAREIKMQRKDDLDE